MSYKKNIVDQKQININSPTRWTKKVYAQYLKEKEGSTVAVAIHNEAIPSKIDLDIANLSSGLGEFRGVEFSEKEPAWYLPTFEVIVIKTIKRRLFSNGNKLMSTTDFIAIDVNDGSMITLEDDIKENYVSGYAIDLEMLTHLK